jgi:transcriptional regulator GlxA family with amidase domain
MAESVHLSSSQFRRIFLEAFGKSPIAYLTMLRVQRMVELLRTTDSTISVIAASVGWGDPDFAARQFRRSVGLSPSEYRRITVNAPKGTAPD